MTELKCNVYTCVHNKNCLCDLDSIEVAGSAAKTAKDTSCASFVEKGKTSNSYSNEYSASNKEPSLLSKVACQATECQYNHSCSCHAGKISVGGTNACSSEETECATFKKDK